MTINSEDMDLSKDTLRTPPRHMVFSKMDVLVKAMQSAESGIPLKNKKNFLTTVHEAFTGCDLIDWLKNHLHIEDTIEATHFGNQLCYCGYIYPTDLKNFSIKDDKSSLYRFQTPFYWPSYNMKPDNIDYAIHLIKRSKRNKQKHGLEEHEQNAIAKLKHVLSDKIEFMSKQADEQIKKVKQMKRADKVVSDSQERAFWRTQRPAPMQSKCVEEGPSRNFHPSQIANRKQKNRDLQMKEIECLKRAIGRSRMKITKALECYKTRNDQYWEFDPILDPSAAQPSNPWISESPAMWELNESYVDMPIESRVRKWAISFHELLIDPTGKLEFESYLTKEYSQENIRFWLACEEVKSVSLSQVDSLVEKIRGEFLCPGAPYEINIDCKTMEQVQKNLKVHNRQNRFIFEPAKVHIYILMKKDSYTRFLRSGHYKSLLDHAQQPSGKKRFFNFGSKRRNQSPSPKPRRRGSASSDRDIDVDISNDVTYRVVAHHSYSTGNLRELEDKAKPFSNVLKQQLTSGGLPSVRRRSDEANKQHAVSSQTMADVASRRRSNLEVPRQYQFTNPEVERKPETTTCLALSVPTKTNVVAPWEGTD